MSEREECVISKKIRVAIVGTGNIGTDLLVKLGRSDLLECSIFAGRNPDSPGIRFAKSMGVETTFQSIQYIQEHPDCCEIVFDATSAGVHQYHAPILKALGKYTIDLTPAHVGLFTIPVINLEEALRQDNVNLITCGGQATIPMAYTLTRLYPNTRYLEMVATIASKSAGPGTRNNIDEFTQATRDALTYFCGIQNTKAIITLNPANPPIIMRNTLYALIENPDIELINREITAMEQRIKSYVPGYELVVKPTLDHDRVVMTMEVHGCGDYLPTYAGNLDIITCAAVRIAEEYAMKTALLKGDGHE